MRKNRFKKCLLSTLLFSMVITMAGCGKSSKSSDQSDEPTYVVISTEGTEEANLELTQQEDASQGEWLAAAAVVGVSMSYGEFEIEHIYVGEDKAAIEFTGDGDEIAISIEPEDSERSEAGTRDLHTDNFGYATFDEGADPDYFYLLDEVSMEDLEDLINQLVLVTVIEN